MGLLGTESSSYRQCLRAASHQVRLAVASAKAGGHYEHKALARDVHSYVVSAFRRTWEHGDT